MSKVELQVVSPDQENFLSKYGITQESWRTLKEVTYSGAEDRHLIMVLDYCKARGLDVFKKPVHLVPMDEKQPDGSYKKVIKVFPSIYELRITANNTGEYAGIDRPEWGPEIEMQAKSGDLIMVPEWCRVNVYRIVHGQRCQFQGPEIYFKEVCGIAFKKLNYMWSKRPKGQLHKCAEAAALRMAFPNELGSEYIPEEMEDKEVSVVDAPTYTDEEYEKFHKYFQESKAVEMYCFFPNLDMQTQFDLYNTFGQGNKTAGKETVKDLLLKGQLDLEDIVATFDEMDDDSIMFENFFELDPIVQDVVLGKVSTETFQILSEELNKNESK